jgi:hypothetical protein
MTFLCRDCNIEFEVDDNESKGYYNWECPKCSHISPKKDLGLGFGIIWNCDTGTTKKKSYIDTSSPVPVKAESKCEMKNQCNCACEKK